MPFYDLNDAPEQRADGVIPDGTYAAVKMTLRPGGKNVDGCSGHDIGLFKASSTSDVMYLDVEFMSSAAPTKAGRSGSP